MLNERRVLDVNQWWLKGGVSPRECLAAFQPIGATNIVQSLQNINGRGINDAAIATTPTWAKTSGWSFSAGSTQYLTVGSGAIKAVVPLSMICLFQADNVTSAYPLMSISLAATAHNAFTLEAGGATSGDPVRALSVSAGTTKAAASTRGYVADTWTIGAAVFKSASDRIAYCMSMASRNAQEKNILIDHTAASTIETGLNRDYGDHGHETTSNTPSSPDTTTIGYTTDTSTPTYHGGKIAACAFYDIALTGGQVWAIGRAMLDLVLMANN